MSNFLTIAKPLAEMGIHLTPVRPGTKRAFLEDFPTTATSDLDQIYVWDNQFPDHNVACVANAETGGFFFWEVDSPSVISRIQKDTGHDVLTEIQTFKVRSRPGRGHFYFRHTPATIRTLPNLSQGYVIGQDWSLRTNREYVVGPGSIHPDTGLPYEALNWGTPITEAPQWLIDWFLSQKIQKHSAPQGADDAPRNERGRVPHGSIHSYMLREAGKLRQQGLTQGEIEPILRRKVEENCEPPIDWSKVDQMAKSVCIYPPGEDKSLLLTGATAPGAAVQSAPIVTAKDVEPDEEIDYSDSEYPVFPHAVMEGTSIYEGFVKPYCEKNSRIDYFMWMPTAIMMMNYLGTKVKVPFKGWKPSFYIVMIGEKGRAHKSSSIKDGIKFLEFAGVLATYSKEVKNADGKSLVWEAGSPEGLGTDMQRTNCKNACLFYDELSSLAAKSQIEGSGMMGALLKMYESNQFANSIKVKKDAFTVAPDSYVASLITATTTQRFLEVWSQFAKKDTGMEERFMFALQPEVLPPDDIEETVSYANAAQNTKAIIDRAVNTGEARFFDQTPFKEALKLYGTRTEIRAEKWALYFAIDLGTPIRTDDKGTKYIDIDEDCVERGVLMARYESQVRNYLKTLQANNTESMLQQCIVRMLKRYKGKLEKRELERLLNASRQGTTIWNKAYYGLAKSGYIGELGKGVKGDPTVVKLLRDMKFSDD